MVCVNSFLVNELGFGLFLDCLKTLSLGLRWLMTRDEVKCLHRLELRIIIFDFISLMTAVNILGEVIQGVSPEASQTH